MNLNYTFTAQWHNYEIDPPKKDGRYIICIELTYYKDKQRVISSVVNTMDFTLDLYKKDNVDFSDRKGKSGWYYYDSEWGYCEITEVKYWMELPKTPIELGQYK